MQSTSIASYHIINSNGLLGKLQLAVYNVLATNGPMTAREVWAKVKEDSLLSDKESDCVTPRFAELKRKGVVAESGKRQCSVSKMIAIEWQALDAIPKKLEKVKTKKEQLEDAADQIADLSEKLLRAEQFIAQKGLGAEYANFGKASQ